MEHDAISPGRDSSIELIRILAMAAIVLSHVTQTLQLPGGAGHIGTIAYCLDFESASPDPTFWVLVGLRSLGCWGNSLFIICSAWFLCRSANVRVNKICKMLMDVFAISIVGFTLALVFGVQPTFKDVAKCLLPNSLATNWFVTCYVLLYAIHPSINLVLGKLGKRGHAALAVVLFLLYMLAQVAYKGLFFSSQLLVMITEYVIVAYGRYYLAETLADAKNSWKVFAVGTLGTLLLIVLLEQVGVRVGSLSDKMLYFVKDGDPLLFLSAFGLFNLIRTRPFRCAWINRISGYMLLVYLIHENRMVGQYLRPNIWLCIHDVMGYDLLFLWLVLFSVILFVVALVCACFYSSTLGRVADLAEPRVERAVRNVGRLALNRICSLN